MNEIYIKKPRTDNGLVLYYLYIHFSLTKDESKSFLSVDALAQRIYELRSQFGVFFSRKWQMVTRKDGKKARIAVYSLDRASRPDALALLESGKL